MRAWPSAPVTGWPGHVVTEVEVGVEGLDLADGVGLNVSGKPGLSKKRTPSASRTLAPPPM
ncbi:hypothetical protein ACFZDK_45505 [Streptomyces sp. NPDC007901]|uniref:hypothetical protein n=1 Tax=Streptomyces sp. NPDC007901 TaxID=3364785 RepID=UPI0036EC51EA